MANSPASRSVPAGQREALRAIFSARGHGFLTNAKNAYLAWEVRTDGKSIFSFYTSGKFVSTVREGDAEGLLLEDDISSLLDGPGGLPEDGGKSGKSKTASRSEPAEGTTIVAGVDETGTGELIGSAILGGALLPVGLTPTLEDLVGKVETKASRAASGWERLGQQLTDLRSDGLVLATLFLPNRLFDRYSKNALLDLAYVRLVGDLLAGAGQPDDATLATAELAVDDYGTGALLRQAVRAWEARGLRVRIETKADVRWIAARAASVAARSARAREMEGLRADVDDGPLGTGNAGNRETLDWLRARAEAGLSWPGFVKTSFKTVTELDGQPPTTKEPVPALTDLLERPHAEAFLAGRLDVTAARVRSGSSTWTQRLEKPARGPAPRGADAFLILLCGGLVLDDELSLETLDELLDREQGFASHWRVLTGPELDLEDPRTLTLARAHARGVIQLVPTEHEDPAERAAALAGLRVVASGHPEGLHVAVTP